MSYYKTKTIMNEKMFARSHRAAEVIYNALAVKSNCFVKANKPVRADFVIAIDDDPTSALWASWMYHKIRAEYGYRPAVLCVGGKGLLSRHTHDKSEAELLRDVCIRLGVSPQSIGLAPLGTNTEANVQAVKKIIPAGQTAIWCITKRQSLRTEPVVAWQMVHPTLALPGLFFRQEQWIYEGFGEEAKRCAEPYKGRVILLVNELTQSNPEFQAMALQRCPQTLTIGSPTSGADGDIVRIPLPGGLMTCFSGIGIFYPDGTPTQAVGVRLDVEVNDTVESLQAGRDLVLEKALELATGD